MLTFVQGQLGISHAEIQWNIIKIKLQNECDLDRLTVLIFYNSFVMCRVPRERSPGNEY